MGARGEGPAEGVGRRQGRGGRAGVREGGPRKVCLRAPTAQHTTRPGSPQGCTNGLPARTGRARQGRRRGYTSPGRGGRGLVELLAPIGRRRGCRRGRWRRPRRRWRRHEPAPGSGGGTSARRHRRLTRSECTPLRLRSDLPSGGGLPICPTTSGHPPTLHLTAPSLPVARAPADRGSRRAVGWRRPRSELIVRPARRAVRAESSALSRGAEGRPPMPERRLERAREHQLTGALQAPPEDSTRA